MNFKTTLFLLVALVIAGSVVLFRKNGGADASRETGPKKLLTLSPESVTGLTVARADGEEMSLTKSADGSWRMTKPATAPAEKFEVDDLVREITLLESRGQVDASAGTGLEKPRYTVRLQAGAKTHEVLIGDASSVGENLYVKVDGAAKADVIAATILERLEKPANTYRISRLAPETVDQIQQVTVTQNGQTVALAKGDGKWGVIAPTTMPADQAAVNDLLYAVTGLRAEEFVAEGSDATLLGQPRLTVSYSTTPPPATQPASTQPATAQPVKTIVFGRYSDISKKNVYATSPAVGAVVKVPATSLDAFNKTPLDLRDKQVLMLDTATVGTVELTVEAVATTQPATKPAVNRTVVVSRRPPEPPAPAGPALPTTAPATSQASAAGSTTQATTLPTTAPATTRPTSKWVVTSSGSPPAKDAAVDALLALLNPLRAEKFVENVPMVAAPAATYRVTLTVPATGPSLGERHELIVRDFGNDAAPIVTYDGVSFEAPKSILSTLAVDLGKN